MHFHLTFRCQQETKSEMNGKKEGSWEDEEGLLCLVKSDNKSSHNSTSTRLNDHTDDLRIFNKQTKQTTMITLLLFLLLLSSTIRPVMSSQKIKGKAERTQKASHGNKFKRRRENVLGFFLKSAKVFYTPIINVNSKITFYKNTYHDSYRADKRIFLLEKKQN